MCARAATVAIAASASCQPPYTCTCACILFVFAYDTGILILCIYPRVALRDDQEPRADTVERSIHKHTSYKSYAWFVNGIHLCIVRSLMDVNGEVRNQNEILETRYSGGVQGEGPRNNSQKGKKRRNMWWTARSTVIWSTVEPSLGFIFLFHIFNWISASQ